VQSSGIVGSGSMAFPPANGPIPPPVPRTIRISRTLNVPSNGIGR
jgi:hypothetical protein